MILVSIFPDQKWKRAKGLTSTLIEDHDGRVSRSGDLCTVTPDACLLGSLVFHRRASAQTLLAGNGFLVLRSILRLLLAALMGPLLSGG